MKKFANIITIIFTLSLFFICYTAYATQNNIAQSEEYSEAYNEDTTAFDFSKPIKVGYYSSFTSFANEINSLNNQGYGVEIFNKIEEVSDLEFEYIAIESDGLAALNNGSVDLMAFYPKTEQRAEKALFSQSPFSKTYVSLLSKDMSIMYGDFDALDGKTVATFEGNVANERLSTLSKSLNFSIEYVYGQPHNYTELEADFFLVYSDHKDAQQLNNVLDIGVYNYFLNTTFENKELLDKIEVIFYDIVTTEGNFFLELEEKYLAENVEINHRGLMPYEVEILQQRPLEVGYIADYAPISFTNESGEPDGAMVETLNYFSQRYNFEVNYHPYSINSDPNGRENYDILVTLYGSGNYDFEHFQLTEAYYIMPLYLQVHRDIYEQSSTQWDIFNSHRKVGLLPYQTTDFTTLFEDYPLTEFVYFNDWDTMLNAFAAREIDMFYSTESASTYASIYLKSTDSISLRSNFDVPMQFFINNKISDEYIPIFNVMLDRLHESSYELIIQTNANDFLPEQDMTLLEAFTNYWYLIVIFILAILMFFISYEAKKGREKQKALEIAYTTDSLTGFLTAQKFREVVDEKLTNAKPGEYEIISFDIDMFKTINTHFSAEKGTTIIVAIANALKNAFENTQTIISRRTADQFLIFRRVGIGGTIQQIYKQNILHAIENNINEKYKVSLSFGNVVIDNIEVKCTEIIGQADNARTAGKSTHKTTFITFENKMRKDYENKINITFRMEQALKDREFVVEYQPKIDFNTLRVGGAEALVRWVPKTGKKIYPDEFIPVFEKNGFISYLDLYVLDEVCKYIKQNSNIMDIPRISVNLSAHTVLADNIDTRISDVLTLYKISPDMIELELTESAVEANTEKFLSTVKKFKKLGLAISIDDFGAGVSSLNRLSAVEADILKLDKAFFGLKGQESKSNVVVTDVINMAKHLNMKVVAEGVETSTQAIWLKGIGCDYAQGYYFAKPMSSEDFKQLLIEKKLHVIDFN